MRVKQIDGNKVVFADPDAEKQKQLKSRLALIAEKKTKRKLALEDIDEKLNIIIEMLQDFKLPNRQL